MNVHEEAYRCTRSDVRETSDGTLSVKAQEKQYVLPQILPNSFAIRVSISQTPPYGVQNSLHPTRARPVSCPVCCMLGET